MGTRLQNKVAIITGSTSGIGRGCAELFAEEGAHVIVNDDGSRKGLGEEVVEHIKASGGSASFFRADVFQSEDLRKLIEYATETYGRLDILMNNAYKGHATSVLEQEEADWDMVFNSSVKAAFLGCKYALPAMIKAGAGSIINTASIHGLLGGLRHSAYASAKAAIVNLTRQMAVDYGKYGIRVNSICPGRIVTEGKIEFLKKYPEEVRRQQAVYPLRRPGTMREAASAALFLASEDASFVTGHALVVDGGLTAQLPDSVAEPLEEGLGLFRTE
ncbi:SDR family NAD(P)-dependent oxidoreductase [Paenibacillus cremeus]|uniref:Glucose 1-dehydrogenase n=1 Tax=Paenibacillus cremeus TaxID=2163881 RepID=A0A559K5X2_9BACL|nr:glucose 1-dehydrogenase [Paenibacillus cremeus]TVY07545.1 glucose 1-dehydrogenase [Paenibacillus cremeus]